MKKSFFLCLLLSLTSCSCSNSHTHTIIKDDAVMATCENYGLTEGSHCSSCGKILKAQEIVNPLGHVYKIIDRKDATCLNDGLTTGLWCERCNSELVKQEVILHKGHNIVEDKKVDATCEKDGYTQGFHCSTCGEVIVAQEKIPATGHSFVIDAEVEPTFEEDGLTQGVHCEICGMVAEEQEIIEKTSSLFDVLTLKKFLNENNIEVVNKGIRFIGSNVEDEQENFINLKRLGIFGNLNSKKSLKKISIELENESSDVYLFVGDEIFPYKNPIKISGRNFEYDIKYFHFFTISNQSNENLKIKSLKIEYEYHSSEIKNDDIAKVFIDTELDEKGEHIPISSKSAYTNSKVSIIDTDEKLNIQNADCGIRLRGNSTKNYPKKPYRLKFDKKQAVFGLTKAKNWVLLAEYCDGSSLHNFITQKMVSYLDDFKFAFNMHHVEVFLNGEYNGLYIMCENPDEKEGRLDIEQDITSGMKMEEINFALELDYRLPNDSEAVEDITYFKVSFKEKNYFYDIKYPEIDAFPDYIKEENTSSMFNNFVSYLKEYIRKCWETIDTNNPEEIFNVFDKNTFYSFGLIDLIANEWDHGQTSFKMYRENNSKLKLGPCWDYDTVAYGFTLIGDIYRDPFGEAHDVFDWIYQPWLTGLMKAPMKTDFLKLVQQYCQINKLDIMNQLFQEYILIDNYLIDDYFQWHNCDLYAMFENIRYIYQYLDERISHFA